MEWWRNAPNLHFFIGGFVPVGKKVISSPLLFPRSDPERSITRVPPGQEWRYLPCDSICKTRWNWIPLVQRLSFIARSLLQKVCAPNRQDKGCEGKRLGADCLIILHQGKTQLELRPCYLSSDPPPSETAELVSLQPELRLSVEQPQSQPLHQQWRSFGVWLSHLS